MIEGRRSGAARWLALWAVLGLGAAGVTAVGAAEVSGPAACASRAGEPVVVGAIDPDGSLRLTDGRVVRLAGIEPVSDTAAHPALAAEMANRLGAWLAGRPATLRPTTDAPDRWGRVAGLVVAPVPGAGPDAAPLSVAVALVDAGLARGRPEPLAHSCWAALRAAEAAARAAGLGLWADPDYAVRDAADGAALAGMAGSMVLVEGRIAHVGRTRTHLYLDLGASRAAVSLRLDIRRSFILDQAGLRENGAVGRLVRARGNVDDAVRPSIDIEDADQIEALDEPGAASSP